MGSSVGLVVRRLRARQKEIEGAVFARVREAVPDHAGDAGSEYVRGLRTAVAAAVEFGLAGIEHGGESAEIPREAAAQAQLAARSGVSLEAVLRRYIVGHALLWDYVMEEADRVQRAGQASGLREISRAQASLLDRLVIGVTREHVAELQRAGRSREQRLLERVRMLLAGEDADANTAFDVEHDVELDYDLEGEHLGVIARGAGAEQMLGDVARELDRRLLSVVVGEGVVWAWLGGRRAPRVEELERALSMLADRGGDFSGEGAGSPVGPWVAVGEQANGLAGWRLTHRQAHAAWLVALRRGGREGITFTRYRDVALLAAALKDDTLSRSLIEMYLAPLQDARAGGPILLKTLHAYVAAERNTSAAAIELQVARSTVINRLRTVEDRLGRTLQSCLAEFEVALGLHGLGVPDGVENTSLGSDFT